MDVEIDRLQIVTKIDIMFSGESGVGHRSIPSLSYYVDVLQSQDMREDAYRACATGSYEGDADCRDIGDKYARGAQQLVNKILIVRSQDAVRVTRPRDHVEIVNHGKRQNYVRVKLLD